jgi:hypothetical protein
MVLDCSDSTRKCYRGIKLYNPLWGTSGLSDQLHAPAALFPRKEAPVPIEDWVNPRTGQYVVVTM